jgi:exosortase/archaeosortase
LDEASEKLIFVSPVWCWSIFAIYFATSLLVPVGGFIFTLARAVAVTVLIGWAFFSRRWIIEHFDVNPILDKMQSDILFSMSLVIFYAASLIEPALALQANIAGSISALGFLFFLSSAPFALIKAENRPSNYGSSTFAAFLMYFYLPLSIYWLSKRHTQLSESLDKNAEHVA